MGKKSKAARKLWLQRNSRVLARRIKKYPKKFYKKLDGISDLEGELDEAIKSGEVDGKKGVQNLMIDFIDDLDYCADRLYKIKKYCAVIQKRTVQLIDFLIDEFEEITEMIEDNKNIFSKVDFDYSELKKKLHDLRDTYSGFVNNLKKQRRKAKDLKKNREKLRDKSIKSTHSLARKIKRRARKIKKEVKSEKNSEKKIKHIPSKLKHAVKTVIKLDDEKKKKRILKDLGKKLEKATEELTEEIEDIKKENQHMYVIETYTTILYFRMIDVIKEELYEKIKILVDKSYPESYMDKIKEEYKKLQESLKDQEEFDYYIEKWLLKKGKKIDSHDLKGSEKEMKELDNLEKAA